MMKWIGIFLCLLFQSFASDLKILYTAALIPYKFEERKAEYIHSLDVLKLLGYRSQVYITESCLSFPFSFFDAYCDHILYANINDWSLRNKGVNEAKAMLAAFHHFQFDDEDMIVKLTGRYSFDNHQFLRFVESHPEADAIARYLHGPGTGIVAGCFAMRARFFKQMLQQLDLIKMEREMIDIEREEEIFLQQMISQRAKVLYVETLGLTANVANFVIEHW